MPLKGDERALLQLVCERGQSYEDIAGLLGTDVAGVQAKARAALTELGGADPDVEVGITDYLLGQSDPIGRADVIRFLQQDRHYLVLAQRLELALLELAPGANLPKLPESRGKRRRAAVPPAGEPLDATPEAPAPTATAATATSAASTATPATRAPARRPARPPRPASQSRTIGLFAGAGVVLLIVILAVAGVFSGDDSSATTGSTTADGSTTASDDAQRITSVPLTPTGDSGVAGSADFGLVSNSQLYVDLKLSGLDPKPAEGTTYLLWLMLGDSAGYPISSPLTPDENGNFSGRLAVPTAVAVSVGGQAKFVKVSASPIDELRKRVKAAAEQKAPILAFTGTELANGKIPLAAPAGG
jgi:hypothetical protein